jgi:hypothetical protein
MSHQASEPIPSTTWSPFEHPDSKGSAFHSDAEAVRIVALKRWASANLRSAPRLRFLLLSERDELSTTEFLIKMELWSKLLAEETRQSRKWYSDRY